MNRMYAPQPDGYPGDEDNGQTSAWYVFSALGFYPVCPGTDQYVMGAPLFPAATLHLENGRKVHLKASDNNQANRYIQAVTHNGQPYTKTYLRHADLLKGGTYEFQMSPNPNRQRGTSPADQPYSFSRER